MKLVVATSNADKLKEIQQILTGYELIPQTFESVPETGLTFVENAIIKARHAASVTGLPALADDSGLVVDALNGAPGIYSARYAGENQPSSTHVQKLLREMEGKTNRTARFYCVLVYLKSPHDPTPIICQGVWQGSILHEMRGSHGFGYDPIFYVPTHNCSAAELPSSEKNRISHRAQALTVFSI